MRGWDDSTAPRVGSVGEVLYGEEFDLPNQDAYYWLFVLTKC
jgi:hypothetical protein